jgi:hypothetical protein
VECCIQIGLITVAGCSLLVAGENAIFLFIAGYRFAVSDVFHLLKPGSEFLKIRK